MFSLGIGPPNIYYVALFYGCLKPVQCHIVTSRNLVVKQVAHQNVSVGNRISDIFSGKCYMDYNNIAIYSLLD